ncbi:MAG: hypothetical protein PHT25_02845, partial [Bacteroidales bacterium]|nr:hypothetical protein [Bacteroidales bacterium]
GDCVQYCSICGSRLENGVCPVCSGQSGGGDQPPADTKYTVSISVDGGGSVTGQGEYTKGTSVTITAVPNQTFKFLGWYNVTYSKCFIAHDKTYSIKVTEPLNLLATFISESSECGKLANLINNESVNSYIQGIRAKMKSDGTIEYGDLKRLDGTYLPKTGTENKASYTLEANKKYTESWHSHTNGSGFVGALDIRSFHRLHKKGSINNLSEFIYGAITDDRVMILQVENATAFNNIDTTDDYSKLIKDYNKKVEIDTLGGTGIDGVYLRLTKFLSQYGIKITISNTYPTEFNLETTHWNTLSQQNNVLYKEDC